MDKDAQRKALAWGLGLIGGGAAGIWAANRALTALARRFLRIIMTDIYDENLWEFASAASRTGLQTIVETNLRATTGEVIHRPFGSPRHYPDFKDLMFDFAQLNRMPTPRNQSIDTSVTLGSRSRKPLKVETPILIGGMAYGEALGKDVKVALALGSARAGTATNTGEGPWIPAERQAARKLILQYSRSTWSKSPDILQQADMIEIQLGQGASGGLGHVLRSAKKDPKLQREFGLPPGIIPAIQARQPEAQEPAKLGQLVEKLRAITGGVPIGVKLAAGKFLERDLDIVLDAGVDVIALDCSTAGSRGAPPIIEDDFGLPTLYALCRAVRFLEETGRRDEVELIIGGGLFTPGCYLKAIALGADAVYIGTMAVYATTHTQVLKALPWEPPTQVAWYDGKYVSRFKVEPAATYLYNYLRSCTEEIKEGIRALGKTSLKEVGPEDLFALNQQASDISGLPLGYRRIDPPARVSDLSPQQEPSPLA